MAKTIALLLWTLVLLASWNSAAGTHFSLDGVLRSRPQSSNNMGTMAWDGILWGAPASKSPLFGYYRSSRENLNGLSLFFAASLNRGEKLSLF